MVVEGAEILPKSLCRGQSSACRAIGSLPLQVIGVIRARLAIEPGPPAPGRGLVEKSMMPLDYGRIAWIGSAPPAAIQAE